MTELNIKHYSQYTTQFREYVDLIYHISDDIWNRVLPSMSLIRVKKGESLLDYHEVEKSIRFLCKGIVKCTDTYNGKSFVYDFRVAPIAICETVSMMKQTPSHISLQALTECDVIIVPHTIHAELFAADHDFCKLSLLRLTSYFELIQYKQILLRTFTTEERYKQFLKAFPSVALKCKQEDIASYINVKPQSLSRIRKNVTWLEGEKEFQNLSNEIKILDSKKQN